MIDKIIPRLEGVRKTGPDRYIAKCPAHQDRSPSLAIKQVDERVLLHCFAGCSAVDIVEAVGLDISDLFPPRPQGQVKKHERYNPFDVLKCVADEVGIIALAVSDLAGLGIHFNVVDSLRVDLARQRIKAALDTLRGA
jgi:hypothetical protein